jgi:hypothetical protein
MRFALLTFVLAVSGCSTAGVRTTSEGNGYVKKTSYDCDWGPGSNFFVRGQTPNSPFFPMVRRQYESPVEMVIQLPLDVVYSPLKYLFGRECWQTGSTTEYVESAADKRKRELAEEASRKERERADSAAEKASREAAAKQAAEAQAIAAAYPPLNESPRPAATRPDDFALIVGIEGYRSIPKADYGESDAKLVKTYVESLGVPPANVVLLTGSGASRSDITKYVEEWLPGVVKSDSRVYFYYSGHGAPDPATGASYLVPYDGDPQFLKSTALPLTKLYADLAALPSKETVVMLDSCFSGAGGRSVLAPGARPLVTVVDDATAPPRTTILAAAGAQEIAGGLDLQKHGLFTYYLLRGLAGEADTDRDGHVETGELDAYLKSKVGEAARRFSNRAQTPRLLGDATLRMY